MFEILNILAYVMIYMYKIKIIYLSIYLSIYLATLLSAW